MYELDEETKFIKEANLSTLVIILENTDDDKRKKRMYKEIHHRLSKAKIDDKTIDKFINTELDNYYLKLSEPLFLIDKIHDLSRRIFAVYFNTIGQNKTEGLMFSELIILRYMADYFKMELSNIRDKIILNEELIEKDNFDFGNIATLETLKKAELYIESLTHKECEYVFKYLYNLDSDWINHKRGIDELIIEETKKMRDFILTTQFSIMADKNAINYESEERQRTLRGHKSNIIVFPNRKTNN